LNLPFPPYVAGVGEREGEMALRENGGLWKEGGSSLFLFFFSPFLSLPSLLPLVRLLGGLLTPKRKDLLLAPQYLPRKLYN